MSKNETISYKIVSDSNNFKVQVETLFPKWARFEEAKDGEIPQLVISDKGNEAEEGENIVYILDPSEVVTVENSKPNIFLRGRSTFTEIRTEIEAICRSILSETAEESAVGELSAKLKRMESKLGEFEKAMGFASEIQHMLMTDVDPNLPLDVAIKYDPASMVSGDVFFIDEVDNCIFIMIADVTDHGYFAGMYGSTLYALAKNYVEHSSRNERSIESWGKYMYEAAKIFRPRKKSFKDPQKAWQLMIAEATLIVINLKEAKLHGMLFGTGNVPPIWMSLTGSAKTLAEPSKIVPPLGEGEIRLQPIQKKFAPGDILFLYTDGLIEIFKDAEEEEDSEKSLDNAYGIERVIESIEKTGNTYEKPAKEILDAVLMDTAAYTASRNFSEDMTSITRHHDDLTAVCIKRKK